MESKDVRDYIDVSRWVGCGEPGCDCPRIYQRGADSFSFDVPDTNIKHAILRLVRKAEAMEAAAKRIAHLAKGVKDLQHDYVGRECTITDLLEAISAWDAAKEGKQ